MKFSQVVEHMSERGFVTRASWDGNSAVCFGLDNIMHQCHSDGRNTVFSLSLADIKANDWMILPFFWNNPENDLSPFSEGEESRKWRYMLGVQERDVVPKKQSC